MRSVRRVLSVLLAAALMTPVMPAAGLQAIRSVSFADANNGYMGGAKTEGSSYDGFVSVTRDGGATWTAKQLPGHANIVSVAGRGGQTAFAIPDFSDNKPFVTSNWGSSWAPTTQKVPGTNVQLTAVERVANGHMIVTGKRTGTYGGDIGFIAESENGGTSWFVRQRSEEYGPTEDTDSLPSNADMRDVATHGAGTVVWAVGNERNPGTGGNATTFKRILIYRSANGGTTWTQQTSSANASGLSMSSVAVASDTTAFIAGNYWTVLKTTNSGSSWAPTTNPASAMGAGSPVPTKGFNDIAVWDANTVVAVGDDGRVARSTNGGTSWVGYQTPQKKKLRSVAMLSATKWIVVGDDETVYVTENAGTSWTVRSAGIGNPVVNVTPPLVHLLTTGVKNVSGSVSDAGAGVAFMDASIKRKDGKYAQVAAPASDSDWAATETWLPITVQTNQTWSFAWTPNQSTVDDGEAWVKVRATDGLGNSSFQAVAYQPDDQPPVITVGGVTNGGTYGGAVTPVFSATDNVGVTSLTATRNGTPFTSGTTVSANGVHTLVVTASDAAGNTAQETVVFTIDSNYPVITANGVTHSTHYGATVTPTFSATHSSGISSLSATLKKDSGSPAEFISNTPVTADGAYTLLVTAVPTTGPTATTQIDFVIDKAAPVIAVSGVTEGGIYKAPVTPTFSITEPNLLSTTAKLNAANFVSGTTIGADGQYTLVVIARDKAGNETQKSVSFRVDTTAPSVVDTKTVHKHTMTEVSLAASDAGSGVKRIGYRIDGGSESFLGGASGTARVYGFGTRKLEYRAYDNANNESDWFELAVQVKRNTTLSFSAPSTSAYASAKVSGTLKDSVTGAGLSGRSVRIEQYSGGWKLVGTAKTVAGGAFAYTTKPTIKTTYRAVYAEDPTYLRAESAQRAVQPKASLGKPWASSKTIKKGKSYTWYSSIKPGHTKGSKSVKLQFQRYKSGKYRAYKTVSATAYNYSTYSRVKLKIKLPYKGAWRVRAVHSDTGHAKSYSSWYKFKVK